MTASCKLYFEEKGYIELIKDVLEYGEQQTDALIGQCFGKLIVVSKDVEYIPCLVRGNSPMYLCSCACGGTKRVSVNRLVNRKVRSCGCGKHGLAKTPEYLTYRTMIRRVNSTDPETAKYYSDKGIKVCERWLEPHHQGLRNFISDLGYRPSNSHTLDRKDPSGDYCPENCGWVTFSEQSYNQSIASNNTSGRTGVVFRESKKLWRASIGFQGQKIELGNFKDMESAVKAREEAELKYFGFIKR